MNSTTLTSAAGPAPASQLLGSPQPFLRVLDIDSRDVQNWPTAVADLRAGRLTAILVRGVYDSESMQQVANRLLAHDPPFLKTWFPEKFRSWFYGRNLNLLETDPETYFHDATTFQQQVQQLLPGQPGIDARLMAVMSQLDGERPYRPAPGPEPGQSYMPLTFRGHADGGHIPAHCDNEQSLRPAYQHLQTLVSSQTYSMVLTIAAADSGGCLEVFDYQVEPEAARLLNDDSATRRPELATLSSVTIPTGPGDLVIVDSGRYLHRVTPVQGQTIRWVACSFMAHSLERNAVYCWG